MAEIVEEEVMVGGIWQMEAMKLGYCRLYSVSYFCL